MRTVARTATKKIAAIKADFTDCRSYDGTEMVSVDADHAWQALTAYPKARLIESSDGTRYTIQVHGGKFYHLRRPAA
jgi:uncharacterized protein YjhX (UPF0386 family)